MAPPRSMMCGRDFVVLSDDWQGLPTSAIHLFRRIGRRNRVFWFNTVGRLPALSIADARKVLGTARRWLSRERSVRPDAQGATGVLPSTPLMVPSFTSPLRRFNRASLLGHYARLESRHGISDPFVVTTFPPASDFVRSMASTRVYYCVDEFLDYPGVDHAAWAAMEGELLESVDGLVVTSKALATKRTRDCPLLYLPHGVEFEHFFGAARRCPPVPRLEQIRRPIVGFFGLISAWVDLDVVATLSRSFPAVSFVLIGRSEATLDPVAGIPNVHVLGPIPYEDLPAHARYFDVGLIPFVRSDLTRAVNPLKLMEYWALGLPVLATRLPELERSDGPCWLADDPEEFCAGLRAILASDAERNAARATEVARRNSWDAAADVFSSFLQDLNGGGRGGETCVP